MKNLTLIFSSVVWLVFTSSAFADKNMREFKQLDVNIQEVMASFISDTLVAVNALHDLDSGHRMFCQPGKLAINGSQALEMMNNYAARMKNNGFDAPPAVVLFLAYKETFPCK